MIVHAHVIAIASVRCVTPEERAEWGYHDEPEWCVFNVNEAGEEQDMLDIFSTYLEAVEALSDELRDRLILGPIAWDTAGPAAIAAQG